MARSLTITLPHPPAGCRPNFRSRTWHAAARAKKNYKRTARLTALASWPGPPMPKATVQVTWDSATRMAPDPDNINGAMKAAFDGLQAAGVIWNDRDLSPLPPVIRLKQTAPAVHLEIREVLE